MAHLRHSNRPVADWCSLLTAYTAPWSSILPSRRSAEAQAYYTGRSPSRRLLHQEGSDALNYPEMYDFLNRSVRQRDASSVPTLEQVSAIWRRSCRSLALEATPQPNVVAGG